MIFQVFVNLPRSVKKINQELVMDGNKKLNKNSIHCTHLVTTLYIPEGGHRMVAIYCVHIEYELYTDSLYWYSLVVNFLGVQSLPPPPPYILLLYIGHPTTMWKCVDRLVMSLNPAAGVVEMWGDTAGPPGIRLFWPELDQKGPSPPGTTKLQLTENTRLLPWHRNFLEGRWWGKSGNMLLPNLYLTLGGIISH